MKGKKNALEDRVMAFDVVFVALFDVLRSEQPGVAMKLAQQLMDAQRHPTRAVLPGVLEILGFYVEVLTRPPTQTVDH